MEVPPRRENNVGKKHGEVKAHGMLGVARRIF